MPAKTRRAYQVAHKNRAKTVFLPVEEENDTSVDSIESVNKAEENSADTVNQDSAENTESDDKFEAELQESGLRRLVREPEPTVNPDAWEIIGEKGSEQLVFYSNGTVVTTIDLTQSVTADLTQAFTEIHPPESIVPTDWTIRIPDEASNPAMLTLLRENVILSALPLSQETLSQMVPAMEVLQDKPEPKEKKPWYLRLQKWAKNHKVTAVFLAVVIAPCIWLVLSAIYAQIAMDPFFN